MLTNICKLMYYEYDEWGNTVAVTLLNNTDEERELANANPLRYRGYYLDSETGYYYLQSRYYDPSICRFINADIVDIAYECREELIGTNLFAYCCNNPINNIDNDGYWTCSIKNGRMTISGGLIKPKYEPNSWNISGIKDRTNCYAYALNIKKTFPRNYTLQPGDISGKYYELYYSSKIGAQKVADQVVKATTADLKKLGYRFVSDNSPYKKSGYKVALVIGYVSKYKFYDYHWYRLDSDGYWSHKRGTTSVIKVDASGKKIKNPKSANRKYKECNYSTFVGIYWIGVKL